MSTATAHRIRYAKLKAAGLCPRCGYRPARPGGVCCEVCRVSMSPASSQELAAMTEWGALKLEDCVGYYPSSGSIEECERRVEEQEAKKTKAPSPEELAWHQASFLVAQCDAKGVAVPGVYLDLDNGVATSAVLPDFAAGDQGQRYVVTAFDPVLELRFIFGWTDQPDDWWWKIKANKRFRAPKVTDRKPITEVK